ncbi:hypothetical protein JXB01_01295 [Candidatus Micrarchaeota archaeon]|nr:hypothetical protein [Candidatus Micrarchaeota archaeon]
MKKLVFALMILGLVMASLGVTTASVSPDSIKPGGSGSITFTVSNSATAGVKASGVYVYLYPQGPLDVQSSLSLGDMASGSSTSVSVPFKVEEYAKSGSYLVSIKLLSQTTDAVFGTVTVNVVNEPIFTLSADKKNVEETDTLSITIKNDGGSAKNLRIKPQGDFALAGTDEVFVGNVDEETTVVLNLDSRSAEDGVNDLQLLFTYDDELGNEISETKTLKITVNKEGADILFIQNSEVITNKDSVLKMTLRNIGNIPLNELKISFESDDVKPKETSEIKVGNLGVGEDIAVSIPIFVSLSPGVNNVDVNLEWKEDGETKTDTVSIPITITSDAEVGIYLEAKPAPLISGQEHTLSVLVSNLGSYKIENVDVEIESDAFELLEVQQSEYIGGLENDDFSTVQFKIKVKEGYEGAYPLKIIINYRDLSGEWKEVIETKDIIIKGMVSTGDGGLIFWIILLAIAGILVWYFKFRGKKK